MMDKDFLQEFTFQQERYRKTAVKEVPLTASGSWTPSFAGATTPGTFTYASPREAFYTRIGGICFIWGRVAISAVSVAGAGNLVITGLPFIAKSGRQTAGTVHFGYDSFLNYTAGTRAAGWIQGGQTIMNLTQSGDNIGTSFIPATALQANSDVSFSGMYEVDG